MIKIKYKEFKDATIKLLNQYSASGNLTPISDSSVQDAVLRFSAFANISQIEIATTVKKIIKSITLTNADILSLTNSNGYYDYTLPQNYFNMMKVENNDKNISWKWRDSNKIGIKYSGDGDVSIYYFAYPTAVPENPTDEWTFGLEEDACQAIPFYVASQVLIDDPVNKSVGTKLFNIYQGKLLNISPKKTQSNSAVKNSMFSSGSKLI